MPGDLKTLVRTWSLSAIYSISATEVNGARGWKCITRLPAKRGSFTYKKRATKPGLSYEEAVEEALCFGWIDGRLKPINDEKYVLRYSPRKKGSVWSVTNKRRVAKLIKEGRMTDAGLAKVKEAKANGQWRAATLREDTTNLPDNLKQTLKANAQAQRNFDRLAPSHKKQYIYWITSAKTDKTRQQRIQETVQLIAEGRQPGG